jgi:hypothetical protein
MYVCTYLCIHKHAIHACIHANTYICTVFPAHMDDLNIEEEETERDLRVKHVMRGGEMTLLQGLVYHHRGEQSDNSFTVYLYVCTYVVLYVCDEIEYAHMHVFTRATYIYIYIYIHTYIHTYMQAGRQECLILLHFIEAKCAISPQIHVDNKL